jgi:hypothetical protein
MRLQLPLPRGEVKRLFPAMKNSFPISLRLSGLCLLALSMGFQTACEKQETAATAPPTAPTVAGQETSPAPALKPAPGETQPPAPAASSDSPESSPAAEAAALETFKVEIGKIKTFMETHQGTNDASAGLANLRELVRQASAVQTDNLPEDLATAYQGMTSVMQRVQSTLSDLPVPVEQLEEYIETETKKGETAADEVKARMETFKAAMENLSKEGETAAAKLKEAGNKYGIESLDLSGQ